MTRARDTANIDTILTTKGDIYAATAAFTPGRLAVGNNGETLLADSSSSTGLSWGNNLGFTAGKNKIINGDFNIWQRGTSFTSPASFAYTADRWRVERNGTATFTVSRQAFTPGSAPVAGYESSFFYRLALTTATSGTFVNPVQAIESVKTLAGQTATLSFWAKADSSRSVTVAGGQYFGTGGSPSSFVAISFGTAAVTTSWQRFSFTISIPSLAGKTIGTDGNDSFNISITPPFTSGVTLDIWGVQLEAGSVATAFQTATGTLAGELAACQRYYYRKSGTANYQPYSNGFNYNTTQSTWLMSLPVTMRTSPTMGFSAASTFVVAHTTNLTQATTIAGDRYHPDMVQFYTTVASGLTAGQAVALNVQNATTGFIEAIAEL